MPRLLTSRGDYGILLMASLAKDLDKKPHSLSEIAASCSLPLTFLEQIAFDLKKSQLLTAQRGRHGGYLLTRRPEMISLVEIWEVLQRHLHKTLQRVTLADLISGNPHKLIPV